MRRFLLPSLPETLVEPELALPAEVAHHLTTVLRLAPGSRLQLGDGQGRWAEAELLTAQRHQARVRLVRLGYQAETALPLVLLQALPAGDKFDWIVQKNTELGVGAFVPLISERCQAAARAQGERKRQRWQRIAEEAARQSGRTHVPSVGVPCSLAEALSGCDAALRLVPWEESDRPLAAALPVAAPASMAVLIGPEGGLSAADLALASAAGFIPVALGPRILRTETAGMALAAILQFHYGDLAEGVPESV
ncbi:MAG: 16S rRNA (uracil(1498)-N(3))-methyltransferase [Desulfuromonas thiophila]|jgi:16S rRNA (uracil1498-N3)-methyltransferase|uniref:16S rRNA (uracil(1498)-N(3))-methyltransferase n=1 Tax=Desulfuromonas thiophila TaxID=57664 RepID=UPI0024A9FBFB|nr:16S rRNA (uracil(1498)-N(3))-methyltransferase [Desulfuromonas thiophila]MDD3801413.1 16S rRNA (uracil(1498)-N(3))-methyltransferase [Desulfuromonas thiophila]